MLRAANLGPVTHIEAKEVEQHSREEQWGEAAPVEHLQVVDDVQARVEQEHEYGQAHEGEQ